MRKNKNVNKIKMSKWDLLDEEQKQIGKELEKLLKKKYDKVEMVYTNLGYETFKRGITVHIYQNDYDYKEINLKYPIDATNEEYFETVIYCMKNKKWNNEHIASPEEKYIIDILSELQGEELYIFDGYLYGNEYEISLNDVDYIANDKINNILEIYSDEEKFEINLLDGTIESEENDNAEPITVDFIEKVVEKFNKLNYWCKLFCDRDMIYIRDNGTNNIRELVAIDDIDYVSLKNKKLFVSHNEDEHGFDSFTINKYGIEM
ncbi:hypothetical protein [Clostridium sp. 001]|uniref:hypothetical protein n=1 Tax=Clostridium sp. 001 TaxID=1970093 RepID=UPI001C2C0A8D|nr:hypothetical protein [Clostridium sp. 001]QXE20032.1 hypothetical protein B5S50_15030 [Clostridium sp. 001]